MGDTHYRSNVKEQTAGLKIAFSNASIVTATITNVKGVTNAAITTATLTNVAGIKKFKTNAGPLFITSVSAISGFVATTLARLASTAAGVNATSLPKGTILTLASVAAPASNLWMKVHNTKTASWINLTTANRI